MKIFKRFFCLFLVLVMFTLCSCSGSIDNQKEETKTQTKYNVPAGLVKKTETVYVNLDSSGKVTQTIVSDWLHTTQAQVYVDDTTNLSQIENIKDDSVPDVNGQNLRWYMNSTDLYYQGKTDAQAPLQFELSYTLDGNKISAEEIIGKSGHIEIDIKMNNIDDYKVKVNGKEMTMYNPMVLVGGISLSEAKFQNITVKNGKAIGSGNNQFIVLAGFPGINESLGITEISQNANANMAYSFDDTFKITADVNGFELGNFMFAALPIASLDIGLNSISTSMDDVRENLAKLQSLQQTLQNIDADKLLNTLTSNPDKLNNLSGLVNQAATLYDDNKALLNVLNNFATPQNMHTIQMLTEYISSADFAGLEDALKVINSIFGDDSSAEKLQEGMNLLKAMSEDLNDPEVQKAIKNLPQTVATLSELQKAVDENRDFIEALQVLAESDVFTSIGSALSGVEGSLAAGGISQYATITGDADEITAKMTAWIELGKRYTIFTKKTQNMTSSVMFVYKVDSLKTSMNDTETQTGNVEAEASSGLGSFFKKFFD